MSLRQFLEANKPTEPNPPKVPRLSCEKRKRLNDEARAKFYKKLRIFSSPEKTRERRIKFALNRATINELLRDSSLQENGDKAPTNVPNICLSLREARRSGKWGVEYLTDSEIPKVAIRFQQKLNKFLFGKAALRFPEDKRVKISCHYHDDTHPHLHILIRLPTGHSRANISAVQSFVESYHKLDHWVVPDPYCEKTLSVVQSVLYNNRKGAVAIL